MSDNTSVTGPVELTDAELDQVAAGAEHPGSAEPDPNNQANQACLYFHGSSGADNGYGPPFCGVVTPISDIRLKRDITPLMQLNNGLRLYRYRYLWSDQAYVGVMAQEVAEVSPEAIYIGEDGFIRVDYRRLGLRLQTWEEWNALKQSVAIAA